MDVLKEISEIIDFILTYGGGFASIVGIWFTFSIYKQTGNIKDRLSAITKIKNFKTDKKTILADLISERDLIIDSKDMDLRSLCNIAEQLSKLKGYQNLIMDKELSKKTTELLSIISSTGIRSINKTSVLLSEIIGILEMKMLDIKQIL